MKYTCTVRTKTQIYKFNSKEEYDKFQRENESLYLKVIERIDIIEAMNKIVQPPRITVRMVWDKLNDFIIKQESFNDKVLTFMENQMKFNQFILKVINLNNLKTE